MPPPPSETLDLILHHLLPLLLLSSLSVKTFLGRWQLLRSKLSHLQASLSQVQLSSSSSAADNPLLQHLLPSLLSTLHTIQSLSDQCRDVSLPVGKLLTQSNLDMAASALSLHLRDLDLLLRSGVLHNPNPAGAIVLPHPAPSASREEIALYVRDLFARLQIGGSDFKIKALDSLIHLLRDDPKHSSIVASEGDIPCLIRLLDRESSAIREQAVLAVSILASASDSSRRAIFDEGGLGPLLRLLDAASTPVKEHATAAVEAITADPENAWAVSAYGGIPALIDACRSGSPAIRAYASGVLTNVVTVEDIRTSMVEEGAIPVLVDLLLVDSSCSRNAAHCLWITASSGDEPREMIIREGGVQKLLQLLQEPPNPETIEHALRAIFSLSASPTTARVLSSSQPFLTQLTELIKQGSVVLQHMASSLICNLSLSDESKRSIAGCMGALVKLMEFPSSKPVGLGLQEVAARALVSLLAVRANRKEFVRDEKNVLRLVQMLDPRSENVPKKYPVSVAAALTAGGGNGCRKRLVAAGACLHLQVLVDMDVVGSKKVLQRLAGSRLKNIFTRTLMRE